MIVQLYATMYVVPMRARRASLQEGTSYRTVITAHSRGKTTVTARYWIPKEYFVALGIEVPCESPEASESSPGDHQENSTDHYRKSEGRLDYTLPGVSYYLVCANTQQRLIAQLMVMRVCTTA